MSVFKLKATVVAALALILAAPAVAPAQVAGGSPAAQGEASPQNAGPDQRYILGPADQISVEVLGREDFKTQTRIGQDGTIQLPYLGTVAASGRTRSELSDQIARALERGGFFEHPIVSVEIVDYASRYVTVLGFVDKPGLVPIDRAYRLSDVLAKVGGVRDGGAEYVILRPSNGPERQITIQDLATGDLTQDPYVSAGDKIFVPKADVFYLAGQVKTPGAYPVLTDMTLRMAISRGGGATELGSINRAQVTRDGKVIHLGLEDKIEPGDVIVVGERLF